MDLVNYPTHTHTHTYTYTHTHTHTHTTKRVLDHKWEEYKGTRYSDGDSDIVVELWLHQVADDLSGLTFQEWDPSPGSDDTSVPVALIVNSRELHTGV